MQDHVDHRKETYVTRMLNARSWFFGLGLMLTVSSNLARGAENTCEQPGRLPPLCYQMKSLRSHLLVLEGQRELMQLNYPLLQALGDGMDQVVHKIIVSRYYNEHLQQIEEVGKLARTLATQAANRSPQALKTVSEMRARCQGCHASSATPDPLNWEHIIQGDWNKIIVHCNAPGRNPYVCRHMNAMVVGFEYFSAIAPAGTFDFPAAEHNAMELSRIAKHLQELGGEIHPNGQQALEKVAAQAEELAVLARQEDPTLFPASSTIKAACQGCHGGEASGSARR